MSETQITIVKDSDPKEVIFQSAEELSMKLITHEHAGKDAMLSYDSTEERTIFMTGYMAAIADYLTARTSGRLKEPTFGMKTKDVT